MDYDSFARRLINEGWVLESLPSSESYVFSKEVSSEAREAMIEVSKNSLVHRLGSLLREVFRV
jgi:hypothetical protein